MGRVFIAIACGVSLFFIIVFTWLLFSVVEIKYLPKTEHKEIVEIIKATGVFEDITTKGKLNSASYLVRFSSGKEKEINFKSDVDFYKGDKLEINYLKTKITKQILLKNYKKVKTKILHK